MSQGSILGPLLFLLYVNDLRKTYKKLTSIMFADDTDLFLSHRNYKTLFQAASLHEWFKANKLSVNIETFLHPISKANNVQLHLPLPLKLIIIN